MTVSAARITKMTRYSLMLGLWPWTMAGARAATRPFASCAAVWTRAGDAWAAGSACSPGSSRTFARPFAAPPPPLSFLPLFAMAPPSLKEVDEGEDQDPHEIDKVPEQAGDFDSVVVSVVVFAHHRADEHDAEVNSPRQNVHPVKARGDVEGIRVGRAAKLQTFFDEAMAAIEEAEVFLHLTGQEADAAKYGEGQIPNEFLAIPLH